MGGKNTEVVFGKCNDDDFQVKRVCIQVFSMVSLVNVNDVYSFVSFYMSIAHDSSILSSPYCPLKHHFDVHALENLRIFCWIFLAGNARVSSSISTDSTLWNDSKTAKVVCHL